MSLGAVLMVGYYGQYVVGVGEPVFGRQRFLVCSYL